MKKISSVGIRLIKNSEGLRLKAYKAVPSEKYWTIGYGRYSPSIKEGQTITEAQAEKFLIEDLAKHEGYVNSTTYVPLTAQLNQNQFDALVSFSYNCGQGNLKTLCAKGRSLAQIASKIREYNKAGGVVLNGLVTRRQKEYDLFTKKEDKQVPTPSKPSKTGFKDVEAGHWAEDSILAVKDARIMVGDANGNFNPKQEVTRAELAIVVARLLNRKG